MENNEYYKTILLNLENQIKNNQFNSKDELNNYIMFLKNNMSLQDVLSNEKVLEYLNLYDSMQQDDKVELDMQNYKGVSLENRNVIINEKDDILLKTSSSNNELQNEFKQIQNEITVQSEDGLANADKIFDHMKEYKKEELDLLSIDEAIQRENIEQETLNKIKFFITNEYINPYSYKVDLENAIFYNTDTSEVLEVRKNEQTGKYEIYKGGSLVYGETNNQESEEQNIIEETNDNEMAYKNKNKNVKVRKLVRPNDLNNSAFAKSSLLFIMILFISIIIAVALIK